ncbi:MAG: TadE/TadG family type IV pilus assembly protein [Candidatus Binatia bacterium]
MENNLTDSEEAHMGNKKWLLVTFSGPPGCRKGQALVEITFGFIIFFAFFMAIVEFSHLLYAQVTLQHALRTAGRYMITGKSELDGGGNLIPRDQKVHDLFCSNVIAAGVQCPPLGPNFTFTCLGGSCKQPGGGPDQTVMVTVVVAKPTLMPFFSQFFPSGGVPIQLSTTWKNEPFPTN